MEHFSQKVSPLETRARFKAAVEEVRLESPTTTAVRNAKRGQSVRAQGRVQEGSVKG